jgi:hypothetical protein
VSQHGQRLVVVQQAREHGRLHTQEGTRHCQLGPVAHVEATYYATAERPCHSSLYTSRVREGHL